MIDKEFVCNIASQLCHQKTPVEAFIGPVVKSRAKSSPLLPDASIYSEVTPFDLSYIGNVTANVPQITNVPPFVYCGQGWIVPDGTVIDTSQCSSVPASMRGTIPAGAGVMFSALNTGFGFSSSIYILPLGTTLDTMVGAIELPQTRAYYRYVSPGYIAVYSQYVYIGHMFTSINNYEYDSAIAYGYTPLEPGQELPYHEMWQQSIFGHDIDSGSASAWTSNPEITIANIFASDGVPKESVRSNMTAPFCMGYRFKRVNDAPFSGVYVSETLIP